MNKNRAIQLAKILKKKCGLDPAIKNLEKALEYHKAEGNKIDIDILVPIIKILRGMKHEQ